MPDGIAAAYKTDMTQQIHPSAYVDTSARIGADVSIGPFAYIGAGVTIGDGCVIHHHATVEGHAWLGKGNEVFPYAYIGAKTHDLKFTGGQPGLRIGDHNVFREYTSVHLATKDGEFTVVGNHNVILAYSHIAHDCQIGDYLVMSSHAALGGHVVVGDYVNVGWGAGIHQFCRLGRFAMVGAASKLVQDVPPFMIADGNPAVVRTVNKVGLERREIAAADIEVIRAVHRILYRKGLNRSQAIRELEQSAWADHWAVREMVAFAAGSERGFA